MSKSRLEKFLYALYSLDSSDLPSPLSRIEELYKCLVTGEEAPTFEPISRVEKYLMAILGGYDVDSLPNPLSRVEVLLYKLATGDDNLDDIKSFLSEHEELLAEIIRNGGVGGNIDIEYVLYTLSTEHNTLYNTAEKPVKSAILKGQTLVNYFNPNTISELTDEGYLLNKPDFSKQNVFSYIPLRPYEDNTEYTIIVWLKDVVNPNNATLCCSFGGSDLYIGEFKNGINIIKGTTKTISGNSNIRISNTDVKNGAGATLIGAVILKGDYTTISLNSPFYGMQSVKMPVLTTTGKNLFNPSLPFDTDYYKNEGKCLPCYYDEETKLIVSSGTNGYFNSQFQYLKFKPNTSYTFSGDFVGRAHRLAIHNEKKQVECGGIGRFSLTATTGDSGRLYVSILKEGTPTSTYGIGNLQIVEGSVATPFEEHKSNILTTNEEVTLRGIGGVRDTLDCITGEVVKRIEETVLNGSENWVLNSSKEQPNHWCFSNNQSLAGKKLLISDKFPQSDNDGDRESIRGGGDYIFVYISKEKVDGNANSFKQWLSQNPIKYQYAKSEKSIKTVDLSVVDQDGKETKLKTFDDITHVTLSSEGLIPEAELEVATKNEEVLNTMSLEMGDISKTQNALQETSNIQSENVDSTMIATTEIYEGLL